MQKKERGRESPKQNTHPNFRLIAVAEIGVVPAIPQAIRSRLLLNGNGSNARIANREYNAIAIINYMNAFDGLFYDAFAQQQRIDDGKTLRDWTDDDDTLATACLQRIGAPELKKDVVRSAVAVVARERTRNSLQEHLRALPQWDGKPRIEAFWIDAVGAPDDDHHRATGRNFFKALVARAMRPGCEQHEAYVLEGDQGIGKNELLKTLGGDFYRESRHRIGSIDFLRTLRGAWIFHMPELAAAYKANAEAIKNTVSTPSDDYPEKYEKHARKYLRTCVIVGSTNQDEYLIDPTGNRRFIPIKCGAAPICVDVVRVNRDQYLAEAMHRIDQGETWHEFPQSTNQVQSDRVIHDVWDSRIVDYLSKRDSVTIDEVMQFGLELTTASMNRPAQMRVSATLRKLGWRKAGRTRTDGRQTTVYAAPDK